MFIEIIGDFDSHNGGNFITLSFGLLNSIDLLRLRLLRLLSRVTLDHLLLLWVALGHLLVVDLLSWDLLAWLHVDDLSAWLLALSFMVGFMERVGELHLPSSALGTEDH